MARSVILRLIYDITVAAYLLATCDVIAFVLTVTLNFITWKSTTEEGE